MGAFGIRIYFSLILTAPLRALLIGARPLAFSCLRSYLSPT